MDRILGPGYIGRKVFGITAAVLVFFFAIVDTTFRVGADASLEGQIQRVIAAPTDSYVGEVHARAGDLVEQGDLILTLDDRDLRLEQIKWETRKAQFERSRQDALSRKERAESRIYKAQADQADAELRLLQEQLARAQIRAPFDGIVVSGDLSQQLGAPVERGQVLMEVAPLDAYRVAIAVDERDIRHVQIGQTGELILPSVPNSTFSFTVSKITPVATAAEGKNTFRIEANLTEPSQALRPGMEGTAKIEAGERRLIWVWTRRFTEWFRVWVWSWWY
jgi:RND family efflux transporter MFP subunit